MVFISLVQFLSSSKIDFEVFVRIINYYAYLSEYIYLIAIWMIHVCDELHNLFNLLLISLEYQFDIGFISESKRNILNLFKAKIVMNWMSLALKLTFGVVIQAHILSKSF